MVAFGEPWPEFNAGICYRDLIRRSDSGATLIEFYSRRYKSSAPLHGWLQRIHNKQITIDGCVVTDPDAITREGAELVYHRLPWKEPDAPYLLEILYEDNDVIALNKPSGLQVLPGGLFQQRTVLTQLQRHAGNLEVSGCQEPHPVPAHRLGRGTSGVLLCAKTKLAKCRLAAFFADGTSVVGVSRNNDPLQKTTRSITKLYRALASGVILEDEVVIDHPIGLVKYPGVAQGLYVASPSGKPALSKVTVLERNERSNSTLVQVEIKSGRPHQIRIHLSFIGHPLVDDPLYGTDGQPKYTDHEIINESFGQDGGYERPEKPVPGDCGYHLHAHRIAFAHPATNEQISWFCR
ncbi:RNA pseudouridine synthase 5 isoform X2 [Salvia miltiorrhiza]|uniref:RNA pseudouridine synthase 5 isoform X2 n=1 Tax=Salvia miltiorrhiza TaxID=226208 RepID=UPI0025AD1A61|nr:RNA pseudouridine synthase 5 isoform X2 [Salvia miltiorrhiza]